MCLVDKRIVRCAEKDIPIFKVAIKKDNQYFSPYQKTKLWGVNTIDFTLYYPKPSSICVYGPGYFHAFTNREDAERRASYYKDAAILEGYIPEGTGYAIECEEICSHKMILNI